MGQVIPFITRISASCDWTAEERERLAELGDRLLAAGLKVEVIYGATEEGDPWCVVKDEHEEVLIHVARIGGAFVIHYVFDDSLREGDDLPAILSERLAWEEPRNVVTFSRHAQSLLVLIVATAFFYESARHDDGGQHFTPPPEGTGEEGAHLAAQDASLPGHMADDALAASKALHAEAMAQAAATPALAAGLAGPVPVWRSFAVDDDSLGRADHGGGELSLARYAPGAALPAITNLEVASPAAAAPLAVAFDIHPRAAPAASDAPTDTMGVETSSTPEPQTSYLTRLRPTDPEPQAKQPEDHATAVSVRWVEVDVDGDGRPDIRVAVPDEAKPQSHGPQSHEPQSHEPQSHEPQTKEPATVHAANMDHEAILAVGHGFEHSLIA